MQLKMFYPILDKLLKINSWEIVANTLCILSELTDGEDYRITDALEMSNF